MREFLNQSHSVDIQFRSSFDIQLKTAISVGYHRPRVENDICSMLRILYDKQPIKRRYTNACITYTIFDTRGYFASCVVFSEPRRGEEKYEQ